MCFSFVVFWFASFRFLLTLLAGETELYVALFVSLHFVSSLRFTLFCFVSLRLLLFCCCLFQFSLSWQCFLCFQAMVFIAMGLDYDTRAGQPVMVCPCLCLGVVVCFVSFCFVAQDLMILNVYFDFGVRVL